MTPTTSSRHITMQCLPVFRQLSYVLCHTPYKFLRMFILSLLLSTSNICGCNLACIFEHKLAYYVYLFFPAFPDITKLLSYNV